MFSFRNHGSLPRGDDGDIGKRLVAALAPRWLRIGGYWYPRGGIPIDVFWQTGEPPQRRLAARPGRSALSRPRLIHLGDNSALQSIDVYRGLALLAMAAYHACWDLNYYGMIEVGIGVDPLWLSAQRAILTAFLLLAGASLELAHAQRHQLARLLASARRSSSARRSRSALEPGSCFRTISPISACCI